MRTAKACGPVPPTLGSTPGQKPGGRRLESPVLRGERAISRKPLRRECRMIRPCLTNLWAPFLFSPRGLSGAASARHSLRPPAFSEGHRFSAFALRASAGQAHHPGEMSRGTAEACLLVMRGCLTFSIRKLERTWAIRPDAEWRSLCVGWILTCTSDEVTLGGIGLCADLRDCHAPDAPSWQPAARSNSRNARSNCGAIQPCDRSGRNAVI